MIDLSVRGFLFLVPLPNKCILHCCLLIKERLINLNICSRYFIAEYVLDQKEADRQNALVLILFVSQLNLVFRK
jgi:hypothetical protein